MSSKRDKVKELLDSGWTETEERRLAALAKGWRMDVRECRRCGGNHGVVEFQAFTNRDPEAPFWWMCPVAQEPIVVIWRDAHLRPDISEPVMDNS